MQSPRTRRAGVIVVGVLAVLALVLAACSSSSMRIVSATPAMAPPLSPRGDRMVSSLRGTL